MGRWMPGESGNPGGRPRTAHYAAATRELLSGRSRKPPAAWGPQREWTNAQHAAYEDFKSWLAGDAQAAGRFLDRAEGRPTQTLELEGSVGLRALPEGVSQEEATRVRRDPAGAMASLLAMDIENAVRYPSDERDYRRTLNLLLSNAGVRKGLQILLDRFGPTTIALPAASSPIEENDSPSPAEPVRAEKTALPGVGLAEPAQPGPEPPRPDSRQPLDFDGAMGRVP